MPIITIPKVYTNSEIVEYLRASTDGNRTMNNMIASRIEQTTRIFEAISKLEEHHQIGIFSGKPVGPSYVLVDDLVRALETR